MAWLAQIAAAEMTCICETACHGEEKSFPPSGGLLTKSKWMGRRQLKPEEKIRHKTKPEMQTKQEALSNS